MGGNALKEYGVERLSKEEFYSFKRWIEFDLRVNSFIDDKAYYFIKAYEDKDSFGDMDILINKKDGLGTKLIGRYLKGKTFKQNSNCYSTLFEWKGKKFQVDFICEKEKNFDFASHYFDYNDLGNLIGRVAHKAGFKFGHDGLWYAMRDGDYQIGKICLTKDFYDALLFLGFDLATYASGFKSLEDIFEFVIENPNFDPESYNLENRSRYARIRDKKRPTYQKFLKYVEENNIKAGNSLMRNKNDWLHKAFIEFPQSRIDFVCLRDRYEKKKKVAEKFNGNILMDMLPLEGKELGEFIQHFKAQFNDFEGWVLRATEEEIERKVVICYAKL